jgi:hypothetical protein
MGKPIIGGKRLGPGSDGGAAALRSKNAIESTRRRGRKSGKSEQMATPTPSTSTNTNLVSPPHACRKAGNDCGCTRRKWSAISFRRWRTTSGERPFAFSAEMRIPVRKRQIFINATVPWVIVQASADQNATTAHVQFGCEARPLRVALAQPAKINNCQNKKSSCKGAET